MRETERNGNTAMHTVDDYSFIPSTSLLVRSQTTLNKLFATFTALQVTQGSGLIRITVDVSGDLDRDYRTAELMGPNGWFEIWRLDYSAMKTRYADAVQSSTGRL